MTTTLRRVALAVVVVGFAPAATSRPASATEWSPPLSATAEPNLVRSDGDVVPVDSSGLGGSMFDRLPLDARTVIERRMEADVAASIDLERTSRSMWDLMISDNLTAIDHRFVEQLSSDPALAGRCPSTLGFATCDAALPNLEWGIFVNRSNGSGSTISIIGGGALNGAANIRPGAFVVALMQSAGHREAVLSTQMSHVGVGVICRTDGTAYMVWSGAAIDPALKGASPDTWQGPHDAPVTPADFGARCPQPAPVVSVVGQPAGSLTITLTGAVQVTACRLTPTGPRVAGDTVLRAVVRSGGEIVATRSWTPFAGERSLSTTIGGLAAGDYTVAVDGHNDCETTQTGTTDAVVRAAPAGPEPTTFTAVSPARQVDTRIDVGGHRLRAGVDTPMSLPNVPADATAVTVNATVVDPVGDGYLVLHPCGQVVPPTSSVNFAGGQTTPVQVTLAASVAAVGPPTVCAFASQPTDLVVDLQGVWRQGSGATFVAAAGRLWDTRLQGGLVGHVLALELGDGAATSDAVSVNVTADRIAAPGFVTVWPCASPMPVVSNLNPIDRPVPNLVTVAIPAGDRRICLYTSNPADLIVDLVGWWRPPTDAVTGLTTSPGARLLDTRTTGARLVGGVVTQVVPPSAVPIVRLLTVTAVDAIGPGWLAVFPCGDGYRGTSTVNHVARIATSNAAIVDATSGVCALSLVDVDVVVDQTGSIERST